MDRKDLEVIVKDIISEKVKGFKVKLAPEDVEPAVVKFGEAFLKEVQGKAKKETDEVTELRKELSALVEGVKKGDPAATAKAVRLTAISDIDTSVMAFLDEWCAPSNSVYPVLFDGSPGAGKTFSIFAWGVARYGLENMVICKVDSGFEAGDFTGYLIKAPDGSFIWHDGPLTRAVRMAMEQPTMLFVDEIYRADARDRSPFINFLSQHNIGGTESYMLNTGRVLKYEDGLVTETESLVCPVHNLAVVGATNLGAQFNIDEGDQAEKERWITYHFQSDDKKVKAALEGVGTSVGLTTSGARALANSLNTFRVTCKKMKKDNYLSMEPSLRTLKIPLLASGGDKNKLKERLKEMSLMWVSRSLEGEPTAAQVKRVHKEIDKI